MKNQLGRRSIHKSILSFWNCVPLVWLTLTLTATAIMPPAAMAGPVPVYIPRKEETLEANFTEEDLAGQTPEQRKLLQNYLQNAQVVLPDSVPKNVYVLAVGINHYKDGRSLRFARADAEQLALAFNPIPSRYAELGMRGILDGEQILTSGIYEGQKFRFSFPAAFLQNKLQSRYKIPVYIRSIVDEKATRSNIEAALRKISTEAKPEDMFVFAFTGISEEENGELYLQSIDSDSKNLSATSITESLLVEWAGQIQANNQLFILDTSSPAAAITRLGTKATTDPLGLKKLGERNILFLGSGGAAAESPKLGHGVLTYALLQAFNGEADFGKPMPNIVTAYELRNYLPWKVAQLSAEMRIAQQVETFFQGKDFWLFPVPPKEKVPTNDVPAIDKTPPSLAITVPELQRGFKLVTDVAVLEVSGQALDASGVREVQVNGKVAELTEAGNFRFVLDVPLGESEVLVRATDVADNTAATTFTVKREASGALVQAVADRRGTDYALFFATADYDYWPKLNNPIRDAEALAGVLQDRYGFHTEIVRNPKLRDFTAKLAEYKAKVYQRDDQLFIFFAGHGTLSPEKGSTEGYLVAKNSVKVEDGSDYPFNYLPLSLLANSINTILCPHILVAVDACYGGIFGGDLIRQAVDHDLPRDTLPRVGQNFNGVRLASAAAPSRLAHLLAAAPEAPRLNRAQYIQRMLRPVSRLFLTSGQIRAVADGPPGGHSPFAQQLLNTLRTRTDEYRVLDFDELKTDVAKLQQEPHYGSWGNHETNGSFLFIAR